MRLFPKILLTVCDRLVVTVTVCAVLLIPDAVRAQPTRRPMTNADVISMVKAGLVADTIELAIEKNGGNFDVSADALIRLREAGVSDRVIQTILKTTAPQGLQPRNEVPKSAPSTAVPRWAPISPGTFQMGCSAGDTGCAKNELPSHTVTLTRGFEMMTTEVTVEMWRSTGVRLPEQPVWNTNSRRPVVNVSWDDARAVCSALGGRLPTEAEWEYAARGGSNTRYPWGDAEPVLKEGAKNGAAISIKGAKTELGTMPVASFEPNGFGLFDIAGNAWEWVADWEGPYTNGAATNPSGPTSGLFRIRRGGSWNDDPNNLRVSVRDYSPPDFGGNSFGVRCVRNLSR